MESEPATRKNKNQGKCLGTKPGALHVIRCKVASKLAGWVWKNVTMQHSDVRGVEGCLAGFFLWSAAIAVVDLWGEFPGFAGFFDVAVDDANADF
ncbi:hypothetical protein CCHOA_09620 [Corynebacterium choanae]|uniref:Uncharacterized protein n=1 Tax=Corynebacterium choanae TaxID=1862358 RepID=A0A3G6J8C0_9CORY|nr:hypothetical protein CCHOA_09620 [Corynebacterium choanae]